MLTKLLFALFFILSFDAAYTQPQEPDSEELEKRNGFKTIKLNLPVDSVSGVEFKKDFKEKNEFDSKLYLVKNDAFKSIGEVPVSRIQLKTYKDLIYEIEVIAKKDPRLMKGLEKTLGKPSYSVRTQVYSWHSKSLTLTFVPHGKNEVRLIYHSYPVYKRMYEDKGKKIIDIAQDF